MTAFHPRELTARHRRLHRLLSCGRSMVARPLGRRRRHVRTLQVGDHQARRAPGRSARQLFSKLSRIITVAAKDGRDPNPDEQRVARDRHRQGQVVLLPKDKIENAIDKAFAAWGGRRAYEAVTYEGYGPAGIAIFVEALTDNRNRTAADVRALFTRADGEPGRAGIGGVPVRSQGRDPGRRPTRCPRRTPCSSPPTRAARTWTGRRGLRRHHRPDRPHGRARRARGRRRRREGRRADDGAEDDVELDESGARRSCGWSTGSRTWTTSRRSTTTSTSPRTRAQLDEPPVAGDVDAGQSAPLHRTYVRPSSAAAA